jgi:hypothetical protein
MNITIEIASDQEHDNVVAEAYLDGKFVALISNDQDQLLVEFPSVGLDESTISRVVPYDLLVTLLERAKRRLTEDDS